MKIYDPSGDEVAECPAENIVRHPVLILIHTEGKVQVAPHGYGKGMIRSFGDPSSRVSPLFPMLTGFVFSLLCNQFHVWTVPTPMEYPCEGLCHGRTFAHDAEIAR